MVQEPFFIKKIAVLGAGVMGAQIAALCVNAGFETLLFDLASKGETPNALVLKAIANLNKLKPTPLATTHTGSLIKACNYTHDLAKLAECDLIIEAIAEKLNWKEDLYQRIVPYLSEDALLVTNTSGLSIESLARVLPETLQARFCGVHFFNPPRYMHLAELIPTTHTSPELLDKLESWLTRYLGKGVVRAKDTPNFIANRVGVFSLLVTLYHARAFGLGFDEVDALTGLLLGRPKSATFRTMDVVGLDTLQHVVQTFHEQLSDDPWHFLFQLPSWLTKIINEGHLGQKSGQGVYRKSGRLIEVYDEALGEYRVAKGEVSLEVQSIFACQDARERMQRLMASTDVQAQFLAACFRDLFHYAAFHLETIANTVREVDQAIRWGFGWHQGPFETWQTAGVSEVRKMIERAIVDGQSMSQAPLPPWLSLLVDFYCKEGAFSPAHSKFIARSRLPVYKRQFFPDAVLSEPRFPTTTLFENEGVRLWHLKDNVAVINFKSKANTIGQAVLDGLHESLNLVEQDHQGLIIYQSDADNFSAGADLRAVFRLIETHQMAALDSMVGQLQQLLMRMKYSPIPIVSALRGRALGGGCELIMHCARVVAAFESYPGLVEMGVGLIPAGGGCKEMARRASSAGDNAMPILKSYFEQIATAAVATSAPDALSRGYLQANDDWVMHADEVLYAALAHIKLMSTCNHRPPMPSLFSVAGREGHAQLQVGLVNWLEGGFISQHDYFIANQLAYVLCGGDVNEGQYVDEQWMLKREREAFMQLAAHPLTQARIRHLLDTGKPLRN